MTDSTKNQEQQTVDAEAVASKALMQCNGQIMSIVGFMLAEYKKAVQRIEELEKALLEAQNKK